ncbi:MAG: hypothetical protein Q7J98_11535, partial [Kiritimatiellia bacterium]|nr:hypothetical protein [Kiritimatiellia bacterium]
MNIKIASIEQDISIQCRAAIDTGVVNEYAQRMTENDKFPPVDLYGSEEQCWIGDGWHRVMAAKQIGTVDIPATLHAGGRSEALKHALGANALHGHRRSNADKRRTVEIALREFPKLSNVQIGKLCGVDDKTVAAHRTGRVGNSEPEKRTGADGKEYPATRPARDVFNEEKIKDTICPASFFTYEREHWSDYHLQPNAYPSEDQRAMLIANW